MKGMKLNYERWKRKSAGHRAGVSCSSGKTRHGCYNSVSHILFTFAFCLFTFLALSACDDTFQSVQDNPDHPFTIYGHLDASVDTNWIRVTPVREKLFLDEGATTDAVVTLEHLETGETAVLKDSLFRVPQGAHVLNWHTTMQLQPAHSYRLIAEKPDGRSSSVTVTLPDTFPDPVITAGSTRVSVYMEGIKNLADATVWYRARNDITHTLQEFRFRHLQDTVRWALPPEHQQFFFDPGRHAGYIGQFYDTQPFTILDRWIYVASAGPEWIYFPEYEESVLELPDVVTNIEGGSGFLIGIVSKSVEF